jgi:murein DD-endopeptidase MepM/ murein hydrolase activator NlpD
MLYFGWLIRLNAKLRQQERVFAVKRGFLFINIALLLAACTSAPQVIQTAIEPTQEPNPTFTLILVPPTDTPTVAVTSTNSTLTFVLNSPLDDTPDIFMNTYFGAVGASPPSPQNPQGIHKGMDFTGPTGSPVKATTSGTISRITTEIKTETDGTINTYANLLLDIGSQNFINYIFEPLQNLFVTEGQVVATGDILGTLGDNRGQNIRGKLGTGTLDFGLLSLVNGSFARICFVPYSSSSFKSLMETWFSRAYTATAEHPGPCVCHYHYP